MEVTFLEIEPLIVSPHSHRQQEFLVAIKSRVQICLCPLSSPLSGK